MARFSISYELKLDDGNWVDISPIVDSRKTSIVRNICTTEFKSAVDTASFTIQPAPEFYALRSTIIDMLMNAVNDMDSHVYVKISQSDNNLFLGVIDVGDLSITTLRIPQSLTINCEDLSTLYLDTIPVNFLVYENLKVSQIVKNLIEDAGYVAGITTLQTDDDVVIRAFVVDADEKDTYRDYIDTLLFEMGGYVLDCDNDGVMNVVRIPLGETAENSSRLVDNYMSSSGIVSSTAQREDDGIQLKWSTIKETDPTAPQTVYVDDIDREIDDNNHLIGEIIEPNDYWPADGAETQAYLEYEAKFLDREYQSGQKKNENKDLSLILVKNASISLTVWNENGEQIEADDAFNYPLPFDEQTNPTFYPTKAWLLLQNKMTTDANLTSVSVQGDCVYRDKINTLLMPEASANPEEYDSIYIYTLERAKHFANFYHDVKRYARTTHTWSELGNTELGSLVKIAHKTTEIGQVAYVVQVTTTFLNKDTVKSSCVAISIGAYNEYPFKEWGTNNGTPADSVYSVTDYYLASNEYQGITINTPGWSTNANYQTDDGTFLWKYTRIQYTSGKVETSAPVIIAVKGDAKTITNIITEYALGDSTETPPESGWGPDYPVRTDFTQYVWQRSKLQYSDESIDYVDIHILLGTVIQYGWSPSSDVAPKARIWSWNNKLMTFGGRCVGDIRQVWQNERSNQPVPGWYLWQRFSFDNGKTWTEPQCLYANGGTLDFNIVGPSSYVVDRGTIIKKQTLTYDVYRKDGLIGDCLWKLDDASWNAGIKFSNGQQTVVGDISTIILNVEDRMPLYFTLIATIGAVEKRVNVCADDINSDIEFVGIYTGDSRPSTASNGKPLIHGDHILVIRDNGNRVPYWWDSEANDAKGAWVVADVNTPYKIACAAMANTLYEALKSPNTEETASIINLFAANVAAQNAFIKNLGTQFFQLLDKGAIYSGGYNEKGENETGTKGIFIDASGTIKVVEGQFERALVSGEFLCSDEEGVVFSTSLGVKGGSITCSPKTHWSFDEFRKVYVNGSSVTYNGQTYTSSRYSGGKIYESGTVSVPYDGLYQIALSVTSGLLFTFELNGDIIRSKWAEYSNFFEVFNLNLTKNDVLEFTVWRAPNYDGVADSYFSWTPENTAILFYNNSINNWSYIFYDSEDYFTTDSLVTSYFNSTTLPLLASPKGWADGINTYDEIYAAVEGQQIWINGAYEIPLYFIKRTDRLDVFVLNKGGISLFYPDGEEFSSIGYYDIEGTVTLMTTVRGLYTGNVLPYQENTLIGAAAENLRFSAYLKSLDVSGNGNVLGELTATKVWGAVAN